MEITKIIKKANYYELIVDEKVYKFKEDVLLKYRILKPQTIDEALFRILQSENDYYVALDSAINYLKNPKTKMMVISYLKKKGLSNENIGRAINELASYHLIDDTEYAKLRQMSLEKKGYGLNYVKATLKQEGIDQEIISSLTGEENSIQISIEKYKKTHPKLEGPELKKKLLVYLFNRGFTYEEIKNSLRGEEYD